MPDAPDDHADANSSRDDCTEASGTPSGTDEDTRNVTRTALRALQAMLARLPPADNEQSSNSGDAPAPSNDPDADTPF